MKKLIKSCALLLALTVFWEAVYPGVSSTDTLRPAAYSEKVDPSMPNINPSMPGTSRNNISAPQNTLSTSILTHKVVIVKILRLPIDTLNSIVKAIVYLFNFVNDRINLLITVTAVAIVCYFYWWTILPAAVYGLGFALKINIPIVAALIFFRPLYSKNFMHRNYRPIDSSTKDNVWMKMIEITVGGPVKEEAVFTGIFFNIFDYIFTLIFPVIIFPFIGMSLSAVTAALISGYMFYLAHKGKILDAYSWNFAGGVLYAYAYKQTGSLIFPIMCHSMFNFMVSLMYTIAYIIAPDFMHRMSSFFNTIKRNKALLEEEVPDTDLKIPKRGNIYPELLMGQI